MSERLKSKIEKVLFDFGLVSYYNDKVNAIVVPYKLYVGNVVLSNRLNKLLNDGSFEYYNTEYKWVLFIEGGNVVIKLCNYEIFC